MQSLIYLLAAAVAQTAQPLVTGNDQLSLEFKPRTVNQMASFYEARGFPHEMIDALADQCYITVRIHNTSNTKIWLELDNWHFSSNGKPVVREHRDTWKWRWQSMGMPMRHQSTFRWTLIPETLDYLPGEEEGGNIVLPFTRGNITLDARFATGEDKKGTPITIHYDEIYCAEDMP